MTIRLILDASAMLTYTKESVAVGELVAELYEEEAIRFCLPVASLAHAGAITDDFDRLMVLAHHELAVVSSVDAHAWRRLTILSRTLGDCQYAIPFKSCATSATVIWSPPNPIGIRTKT